MNLHWAFLCGSVELGPHRPCTLKPWFVFFFTGEPTETVTVKARIWDGDKSTDSDQRRHGIYDERASRSRVMAWGINSWDSPLRTCQRHFCYLAPSLTHNRFTDCDLAFSFSKGMSAGKFTSRGLF